MRLKSSGRFRPGVDSLETRALLSAVTAQFRRGNLTISRDDAATPIQVVVQTLSTQAHRPGHASKGAVVVEGVGRFDLRRVRAITINAGPSLRNISVSEPPGLDLPVRIVPPPAAASPPAPTSSAPSGPLASPALSAAVPGVTGAQSALEQQVFDLVNAERVKAGLAPLRVNAQLVTAAQIHARDMAAQGQMLHELPGVAQPTLISRAQFVGYRYGWLGENIATGFADAGALVAAWMASPGHRANILSPDLTEAGLGVGRDARGALYFCQEFGSPA